MQIVIDIPDEYYNQIMKSKDNIVIKNIVYACIESGTPLPKGHGRLIDADKALDYFTTNMNWVDEDDNRIDNSDERKAIFKDYFDGVPTILEADKEADK